MFENTVQSYLLVA